MMKRILVAVDGSDDADAAVEFAANLAKQEGDAIHFFHVVKTPRVPLAVREEIDWRPFMDHYRNAGKEILSQAKEQAKQRGVNHTETAMREGDPGEIIVDYAKSRHFDMVVLGGRGVGSPKEPGLGGVAGKVCRGIDKTCVIVRRQLLPGKKILIVDDEPDILDTLEELLPMCDVVKAADFETAKTLLESKNFDIAILDIMGVDGYALLDIANERKVIAVILTAHALSVPDTIKSFRKGAASYVPKDEMGNITVFLEDILEAKRKGKHLWWRWFERLGSYYEKHF